MKRIRIKNLMLLAMLGLFVFGSSITTFAADSEIDTAGNQFLSQETIANTIYERDLYWAGENLNLTGGDISQDALLLGNALTLSDSEIGGSLRSASYKLLLSDTIIENNITAAGYSLNIEEGTVGKGVYLTGNDINFAGECDALTIAANTVYINGIINGDATIGASNIVIGPNAVVTGDLNLSSVEMPDIPETASISATNFTATREYEDSIETISVGAKILQKLFSRLYWIPAMLLITLFFCLLIPDALDGAGSMIIKRKVAMPVTGFVSILALPMLLVFICITFIGLPLAGLLLLLLLPLFLFAVPFTGASIGRIVFPKMNVWISSIIGAAVLTFVIIIPILGGLIRFASVIYVMGYFVLKCYERLLQLKNKQTVVAQEVVEATEVK